MCLLVAAACDGERASAAAATATDAAAARTVATTPANPLVDLGVGESTEYDATVVASLAAGEYSYVELEPAASQGERRWAVTLGEQPPVGALVHARVAGTKHDFESRRLQRRFERLDFAALELL
ncbi:MAG: hypothetical protein IPH07_15355 [Deltaproteobacteria bacterium]|nr:hypothetical protein [Deltaproteobacteria bacterium]MBK8239155.1 hypothetical protein [Deltaproteobacteria bacterium]MBK8717670.1 hypothetical protein [Deltaproteobacteria bacterium]MBP7285725.1 hypothetical protein [Nannocystaceae bacterium]